MPSNAKIFRRIPRRSAAPHSRSALGDAHLRRSLRRWLGARPVCSDFTRAYRVTGESWWCKLWAVPFDLPGLAQTPHIGFPILSQSTRHPVSIPARLPRHIRHPSLSYHSRCLPAPLLSSRPLLLHPRSSPRALRRRRSLSRGTSLRDCDSRRSSTVFRSANSSACDVSWTTTLRVPFAHARLDLPCPASGSLQTLWLSEHPLRLDSLTRNSLMPPLETYTL